MKPSILLLLIAIAYVAAPTKGRTAPQSPTFNHSRFSENGKTFSQDGANVVADCMAKVEDDQMAAMFCGGYVGGIADLLSDSSICIPPEVLVQQLASLVLQYAAKHQDMLHGPASRVVSGALRENYACGDKPRQR